jgi:hypothetical protein
MIPLTSAAHGGRSTCGSCEHTEEHTECGPNCECGCPYTAMRERGHIEAIAAIEQRYPGEWLGLVIPPDEDDYAPEHALLVVHSPNDDEVWEAVARITHNQVVHVYYNGPLDAYLEWAEAAEPPAPRIPVIPLATT